MKWGQFFTNENLQLDIASSYATATLIGQELHINRNQYFSLKNIEIVIEMNGYLS